MATLNEEGNDSNTSKDNNEDGNKLNTSKDNQVSLKLNKQALHNLKGQRFENHEATVQLDFKQTKAALAVKIEGQVAGVFTPNQKASQTALMKAFGKTVPQQLDGLTFESTITSNLTTASVQIKPETMNLGEIKEEKEQRVGSREKEGNGLSGLGYREKRGALSRGNLENTAPPLLENDSLILHSQF